MVTSETLVERKKAHNPTMHVSIPDFVQHQAYNPTFMSQNFCLTILF